MRSKASKKKLALFLYEYHSTDFLCFSDVTMELTKLSSNLGLMKNVFQRLLHFSSYAFLLIFGIVLRNRTCSIIRLLFIIFLETTLIFHCTVNGSLLSLNFFKLLNNINVNMEERTSQGWKGA